MQLYVVKLDDSDLPAIGKVSEPTPFKELTLRFQSYSMPAGCDELRWSGPTPEIRVRLSPPTRRKNHTYDQKIRASVQAPYGMSVPTCCVFYSAVITGNDLILHRDSRTGLTYVARTEHPCLTLDDSVTNALFLTAHNLANLASSPNQPT